ncbi:hypothetical protein J6590_089246 [Homalodisca vitripennis]|nr:hypothetical protein J6590_089246 [Homalodisca vitripennis]
MPIRLSPVQIPKEFILRGLQSVNEAQLDFRKNSLGQAQFKQKEKDGANSARQCFRTPGVMLSGPHLLEASRALSLLWIASAVTETSEKVKGVSYAFVGSDPLSAGSYTEEKNVLNILHIIPGWKTLSHRSSSHSG